MTEDEIALDGITNSWTWVGGLQRLVMSRR